MTGGEGWCSYILSTVWICSIDFTLSQMCESAWNRPIAVGGFEGSFNANTKERYFVTISICPFQVYIEGRNRQNVRKYRAVCLSRVYCAWNCWGGGLFERGGLTRELRTLIEGAGTPRGRSPVKARYEAPSLWMRKILRNTKSAEMDLL